MNEARIPELLTASEQVLSKDSNFYLKLFQNPGVHQRWQGTANKPLTPSGTCGVRPEKEHTSGRCAVGSLSIRERAACHWRDTEVEEKAESAHWDSEVTPSHLLHSRPGRGSARVGTPVLGPGVLRATSRMHSGETTHRFTTRATGRTAVRLLSPLERRTLGLTRAVPGS